MMGSEKLVDKTASALREKKYLVDIVDNGEQALEKIKELIPKGASVMNGSSVTLDQIGFIAYLDSGDHPWENLHQKVTSEDDKEKRDRLRKESTLSDYYLGSVHALTQSGEFLVASNTGSQLPHIVFTSPNLIFVVSTKKIVENLDKAFERLNEHVVPLEDKRMQELYNINTQLSKIVVFKGESSSSSRKIHFILVKEDLGF